LPGSTAVNLPMPITDVPVFSALRTKMQWHQERQRLLSENVANADTPSFRPRDLAPIESGRTPTVGSYLTLTRTDAAHLGAGKGADAARFALANSKSYDVRPAGNAVNLEDEMIKVANNQMDYQAATSLYARSLGLLKTAMGKR
jgi:flagellar basal-body rod protein FlgB